MKARRFRRQSGDAGAGGMTQQDREAIRTYRTNRGSKAYYRDLNAIDDKPLPASAPADKDKSKGENHG